MRTAAALLLVLSAAVLGGRAQSPAAAAADASDAAAAATAPEFQIVKYSWSKDRIGWERDPFGSNGVNFGNEVRVRATRERRSPSVLRERDEREQQAEKNRPPEPPRYVFRYKLSVLNAGPKAVKEIDWDYVFTDAVTGEELGRHAFTSVEKVGAGKRKELSISVSSPPTRRISVYTLGKSERDGLAEQVRIVRVLYEDGTVWQLP